MQPLGIGPDRYRKYVTRLFSSHDYTIDVDVLDMNERPTGSAVFLDGQVNLQSGDVVRRTATLTLSDPAGALDFIGASAWSGGSVWVDRLIRVRHTIAVPGVGNITATPFIGPPVTFARHGADVEVELHDKTALAVRGCPPMTVHKGANAVSAIKLILSARTGEFRFRFPAYPRRLSKPYSVGWADETSPWTVASQIARNELGCQLIYSCDGYATLRHLPTSPVVTVSAVTGQPETQVDFTTFSNWVRVLGAKASQTVGSQTVTTQPEAVVQIAANGSLSPQSLSRKGVPRYLPLLVDDDAITKLADAKARAVKELSRVDRLQQAPTYTCVPFFHADADDLVKLNLPEGDAVIRLGDASIPLGVGGDMSIGTHRWVSQPPGLRTTRSTNNRRSK